MSEASNNSRWYRVATLIAVPLALVAFIPSGIGLMLVDNEIEQRTAANRELIAEVHEHEFTLCRDTEKIKATLRSLVKFDERGARRTLRELGIDPDGPQGQRLIFRSRNNSQKALNKLAPRKTPCLAHSVSPGRGADE